MNNDKEKEYIKRLLNSLTEKQSWLLADKIAEERLPGINQNTKTVMPRVSFYTKYGKRILDICISFVALIITIPINLLIAFVTLIDLGFPLIFRQKRAGKDGRLFTIYKFRNMTNEVDDNGDLLPSELRITKCGAFWRKTSLDELLNFWSILKGDMSIIGPRPLVPEYTHRLSNRHQMRLVVRPGLECPPWKRLNHYWTWDEQFENDIWYVENVSFWVDVQMCFKLILFMLDRKNAALRNCGRGSFAGYSMNGKGISYLELDRQTIERMMPVLQIQKEREAS